jgi:mannose-6-phosphate isomerase-like protein (cupin superfamily)
MPEPTIRRVVTGHDEHGKAIVIADGPPPLVHTDPRRPGYRSTDLWRTNAMPAPIVAHAGDPTPGPRHQLPNKNGTVFRINEIAPDTEALLNLDAEAARDVFASMGNETASTFALNRRHPMMHRTETVDYAMVLEGELTMVLDDQDVVLHGGDVVIQLGTNHAWANRSAKTAKILFVLIDGEFGPDVPPPAGH